VFLSGGFRLTAALLPLQNSVLTIKAANPSAITAHDILNSTSPNHNPQDYFVLSNSPDNHAGRPLGVVVKKVTFQHDNSTVPAVSNVSFEISPGQQVALMGPSGAGKSTIADQLSQVIEPQSGSIEIEDSRDLSPLGLKRGKVSYVPQRPGLISGTILDNVALGVARNSVDRQEVDDALKVAHLWEFIQGLPEGVNTKIGNLKDGLSGGQAQRLGLARALYTKPGLLVMDEATSALDAESEHEIQKALDDMRGKVTVVLIAHRLNTIQHADTVFLLESGQLRDSGTFNQLLARNPSVERVVKLMEVEGKTT
jgi:ATP-binding cassette subfamily C protein